VSHERIYRRAREGKGLKCPMCGGLRIGRTETRKTDCGFAVRRRNLCASCHHRWSTYEYPEKRPDATERQAHQCFMRWINEHDIQSMGVRAVKETA